MAKEKESLENQNRDLNSAVRSLKSQLGSAVSENQRLRSLNQSLQERASQAGAGEGSASDQVMAEKMEALSRKKDLAEKEATQLRAQIFELKGQLVSLKQQNEEGRSSGADKDGLKQKLSEVLTDNETLSKQVESLRIQNRNLTERSASEKEAMAGELESLRSRYQSLQAESEGAKNASSEFEQLKADNVSLKKMYSEATYSSKKLQMDLDKALTELNDAKSANLQLISDNRHTQEASAQLDQLRMENAALRKLQNDFGDRLKEKDEKITSLLTLKDGLVKENTSLKTDLKRSEAERTRTAEQAQEVQRLANENEMLKKTNADLEYASRDQSDKFKDQLDRLSELERSHSEMKRSLAEKNKIIEELNSRIRTNLADIQNLRANLSSYLESLVQDFEKRQGQNEAVPAGSDYRTPAQN